MAVQIAPAEETLWSKAFVMERERFDGADVAHIILAYGERLDWGRLRERFGAHWRVLLAHLVLFGFIYPSARSRVPVAVMEELLGRLTPELLLREERGADRDNESGLERSRDELVFVILSLVTARALNRRVETIDEGRSRGDAETAEV